MIKKKYSKNFSKFYIDTKSNFFFNNDILLKKAQKQNKIYSNQPIRRSCKICGKKGLFEKDLITHKIYYSFCKNCNHLNGEYEDTETFVKNIYISDSGLNYSKNYIDKDFHKRSIDIYLPKLNFLISTLPKKKFTILDVGCGSGYFVYASLLKNISAIGIDVNKAMIKFGNNQIYNNLKKSPLKITNENEFFSEIKNTNFDVISAIGVIEHLREPKKFFKAFKLSKAKYLYYSVPMFSLSVIFEIIFQNVFPRQLSGAHTHLFTEKSISKMNDLIGVNSIGEWRFGTDFMDLYRNILFNLKKQDVSENIIDYFNKNFLNNIDNFQPILDKNHSCSEIHVLAKKA